MSQIKEYFKIAFRNLRTRSLRSWLTIFGIVIGVFLIVSLLSLSQGVQETINEQLSALGGEMIFVMPGDESNPFMGMMMGGDKLEREDIEAIKKSKGVEDVLTMSYRSSVMRYKEESKTIFIAGVPWKLGMDILKRFQGWSLSDGRWPIIGRREVVVGQQVVNEIFKDEVKVNTEAIIKGSKFKIVGILNSLGSKSDDSFVYMDMDLFQDITGEKRGSAQMAMVKIEEGASEDKVAEAIKESLAKTRKRRIGTDAADFAVITSSKISGITEGIMKVIEFAIAAFAGIAILVGAIGIMNTMFTSVRERTREIGIMKAIGAKNSAVLTIFLVEAGIIGLGGGIGGIILGVTLAEAIELYGQAHPLFYFSASITPGLIIFSIAFSFLIGSLAGLFPARGAAKLKPVEALRRFE